MERKLIIIMLAVMLPTLAFSQCRRFTKVKCLPALSEYIPNDNFNSAVLIPGDQVELSMTFYAGQDYRVMLCTEEILGEVAYTIYDSNNDKVFDSANSIESTLDFSVASTQKLRMEIRVPEQELNTNFIHEGCATVVVGHKDSTTGSPN